MLTDPVREDPDTTDKKVLDCHSCITPKGIVKYGTSFWDFVVCFVDENRAYHIRRSNRFKTNSPKGKRYAY